MTVALVTGAAGFIARHLTPVLRQQGFTRVAGADLRPLDSGSFDEVFVADLSVQREMERVVQQSAPTTVFHLAGVATGTDAVVQSSNVDTASNLIETVRQAMPSTRIVLIGSAAEYGEVPLNLQPVDETYAGSPVGPYGKAKAAISRLAAAASRDGLQVVVARPFNIIGPGVPESLVVGALAARLRRALAGPRPRTIQVGTTTSVRDFIAVEDVVDGLILAGERGAPGAAYNLCTGAGRSIADVLHQLTALAAEDIAVESDASLFRDRETSVLVGSRSRAERELGWSPRVSFETSLRETWEASASPLPVSAR